MVLQSLHPPWFPLQVPGTSRELGREDEPKLCPGLQEPPCRAGVYSAVNSLIPTTAPTASLRSEQSSRNRKGHVAFLFNVHAQTESGGP